MLGVLARAPPNHSQIVMRAGAEGLSYREITAALGIPVNTVMSRLDRGRKMLRAELAGYAAARGIKRKRKVN